MSDTLQIEDKDGAPGEPRRFPLFLVVLMTAVVGASAFYFWTKSEKPKSTLKIQTHLAFGKEEKKYAAQIHIENISLSRAENFLHQEVTSLSGEIVNGGGRSLQDVELTITFFDELHQVVLRESRVAFGGGAVPLPAGGRRQVEISFEHIPSSWNRESPEVTVTGMQF